MSDDVAVDVGDRHGEVAGVPEHGGEASLDAGHQHRRHRALPGHVTDEEPDAPVGEGLDVEEVACENAARSERQRVVNRSEPTVVHRHEKPLRLLGRFELAVDARLSFLQLATLEVGDPQADQSCDGAAEASAAIVSGGLASER